MFIEIDGSGVFEVSDQHIRERILKDFVFVHASWVD
jgi:hypothetical protein